MKNKLKNPLVEEVKQDFRNRQQKRKCLETQWQMNMNFFLGNQFCSIGYGGEIEDFEKQFFWQEREVFNHIAPIVEMRMAKLSRIKPKMSILPSSNDFKDVQTAKVSKKVLQSVSNKINISSKVSHALKWSEICGTSFYKVVWNGDAGQTVAQDEKGNAIKNGEVEVSVLSPFEIFPDSDSCETIESCQSIIHARVCSVEDVKTMFNVDVVGQNMNVYGFDSVSGLGGLGYSSSGTKIIDVKKKNSVLVLERYEKPCNEFPNGRLVIVAGDHLVFDGELPFENMIDQKRGFPFIKQVSIEQTGSFWGNSIIDRLIPLQRSYNAVKNRKHEFLNRLSMGVLKVEDGSIDIDNLEDEGLCPGKVLVYRQGSTPPSFLNEEPISSSFAEEEEKLLEEFRSISGMSEVSNSDFNSKNISATALELLVEQDELRLSCSSEAIKFSIKNIASQILHLYKQFAILPRLEKIVGENGEVELLHFNQSDISSDDIIFETQNEISESLSQRRKMLFDLLNAGLLNGENGELSNTSKAKFLELLGLGIWENAQDLNELHIKKAERENQRLVNGEMVELLEIDDNTIHIDSHIAFMLGGDFEKLSAKNVKIQEMFLKHIDLHRNVLKNSK